MVVHKTRNEKRLHGKVLDFYSISFLIENRAKAETIMAVSTDSAHKGIQERFTAAVNVIRGLPKNGKQTCQVNYVLYLNHYSCALVHHKNNKCRQSSSDQTIENKTKQTIILDVRN